MTVDIIKEIYDAVMEGKVDDAASLVQQALNSKAEVNDILNKGLIAAMDVVGEKFGEGELFIPQVLWSAKAMQAGMDLLKPLFSSTNHTEKGTVVIGTAKGDIHDIGKNLVAIMLEGSGFKVADSLDSMQITSNYQYGHFSMHGKGIQLSSPLKNQRKQFCQPCLMTIRCQKKR